jgi:hypothetical protein
MKKIEVGDFVENEDGSATMTVSLDYDTLIMFARKGILATLIEAANKAIEDESQDQ